MVLNLRRVYQPPSKEYNIIIRNHRDNVMAFCPPKDEEHINFDRWLDSSTKCTEINITNTYGRLAILQLEDDNWKLVVSGNIVEGRKAINNIGGSRDFDVRFTGDGHMLLQCWNGKNWGKGAGNVLDFTIVPFQASLESTQPMHKL
ncbi:uncharacterized protein F4807DRAFT_328643 [Annulohypoxylon truncatum]|uniref:uncharacterized protein n=1 Tax=Annulohypoxylon truncatum TaxID=327061 RepID=UPI0020085A33|nr:uncharacterized protein F4807DRAFT_328643 [Annulohypoxylon truncatum]KAI1204631.1 hypothetical protein F4807DRAFT_328643 [Annulohypoxylon truncatum]